MKLTPILGIENVFPDEPCPACGAEDSVRLIQAFNILDESVVDRFDCGACNLVVMSSICSPDPQPFGEFEQDMLMKLAAAEAAACKERGELE